MRRKLLIPLLMAAILLASVIPPASAYTAEISIPEMTGGAMDENFPVLDYEAAQKSARMQSRAKAALPSGYDLRDYSWVSSVKNQGLSSLCWAFSAAAVAESAVLKSGGPEMDYSEQHLAYSLSRYTTEGENGNDEGFDRTVNGTGGAFKAQAYLSRNSGLVLEKDDPFTFFNESGTGALRPLAETREKPKAAYVGDFINIPNPTARTAEQIRLHRETVKRCLMEYGAVGMAMYFNSNCSVTNASQTAQGKGTLGNYYYDGTNAEGTSHVVTIIGWDDNYPRENFRSDKRPSANGAFKIKNSYGTDYNDQGGYFWLSYEDYYAGWYAWCIKKVTPADTYASVYYHDPFGSDNYIIGTGKMYGANVFKRNSDKSETVTAVGVTVLSANTTVSVYVNDGKKQFTPSHLTTQSFELPGYYTILLDQPVTVTQSEFTVGAIYTPQAGDPGWLPFESKKLASLVRYNPGESFYSKDGVNYTDAQAYGNMSIRALTSESGITLSKEELSMRTGGTAVLKATVSPQPDADVTWSSSNPAAVRVNNGVLTAVAPGTAQIIAVADNGASSSCTVTVRSPLTLTVSGSSDTFKVGAECTFNSKLSESVTAKQMYFSFFRDGKLLFTQAGGSSADVTYVPNAAGEYLLVSVCRTGNGEIVTNHLRFTVAAG